jgi:hypothetical protein
VLAVQQDPVGEEVYVTHFRAPKQSNIISTLLERSRCSQFMLNKIRWMAISPSNSPLYAFGTNNTLEKESIGHIHPLAHYRTKAAEQRRR